MTPRAPIPTAAAAEILKWMDDLTDPAALALVVAQAREAADKAFALGACREAAEYAMCRRFVESLALDNPGLLRKLGQMSP